MRKTLLAAAITMAVSINVSADRGHGNGPFSFEPIAESASSSNWNPAAPWIIPQGFEQSVVSDETALNIYDGGRDDWHDMNTVNETGKRPGKYMYTTHEVRGEPEGGSVSVVNLKTGETRLLAQDSSWDAVDGIRWTPWGTILIAEEVTDGRLFEIILDEDDLMVAADVIDRPAVGRLAHEGIAVGPDGSIYVVDEFRGQREGFGGGVYKFVADNYGDLSSGKLYALKVTGNDDGTGQGEWVGPIDPANARTSGTEFGGTGYNRPEDLEVIGNTLYVAVTEGTVDANGVQQFDGRVLSVNLWTLEVKNFVKPGLNVPVEIDFQTGFDNPDNLARTHDGKLVIVEDNVPSDIWIADPDMNGDGYADNVSLFASLTDPSAEGTGIYFGKDPNTLFVNVQHSAADDGDATWAITRIKDEHAENDHGKGKGKDKGKHRD